MLKKTHLALGLAISLYFLPLVSYKFSFIPVVLLASILPDIDSSTSSLGQRRIFRPVQFFFKHRGPIHSYTLCILFSVLLAFFYPILALPFFIGYSFHLFLDSFTVNGIRPFWPFKVNSAGLVKTGGVIDKGVFLTFLIISVFLAILFVTNS